MFNTIKPALALFMVTFTAALLLGAVFTLTEEPIAVQKAKTEVEIISRLIPGVDKTETIEVDEPGSSVTKETRCFGGGQAVGYVISASPKGYSGSIDIMVACDMEGVILGLQVVNHTETPGLGSKAALPEFTGQYIGKSGRLAVTKSRASGNQIEAIASVTITVTAITAGVNDAMDYFEAYLKEGGFH